MESNQHVDPIKSIQCDSSNDLEVLSWKKYKARANFRLQLQMEALKRSLNEQMRDAKVLNMIELPPDNMDEEEIFNDRLEYREGELAGNYGKASKEAIEAFYGESKPVFKYAGASSMKNQAQLVQGVPEMLVIADAEEINQPESSNLLNQIILLDNKKETSKKDQTLFELDNDMLLVIPEIDATPDLLTMDTQVELAGIDITDFSFVNDL